MQFLPEEWRKLSHRQRRCHVNKERRKHRRGDAALCRKAEREAIESQPGYLDELCAEEKRLAGEERRREDISMLENAMWMKREREAQENFRKKREVEEKRKKEKEERESLIREEWASLQRKEKEEQETRDKARQEKEERLQEALNVVKKLPNIGRDELWHNPIAPEGYDSEVTTPTATPVPSEDHGTERDVENCSFYLKTGACRFGDRCSRRHPRLTSSCSLMIPGMYTILGLQEQMLNERDQDVSLEYDESDVYEDFRNFFSDALPEFSKAGKIVQFKVACNHEVHLRGNVFVQYSSEVECSNAFSMFNGRWYAQKQLSCEYCPIKRWKNAICGLYNQKRCPKGRNCNFLHVFPNPNGAFSRADRDLPPLSSPPPRSHQPSPQFNRRNSFWSRERRYSISSRRSKSRERSFQRSRYPSTRSKSRERRSRRSKSLSRSKSRERQSRRSKSRSRSKSRERWSRRSRMRSKSKERSSRRSCSRSKPGVQRSRRHTSHSKSRSISRSPHGRTSISSSPSTSSEQETSRRRHTRKKNRSSVSSLGTKKKKRHRHRKNKKKHSKSDHTHHHRKEEDEEG